MSLTGLALSCVLRVRDIALDTVTAVALRLSSSGDADLTTHGGPPAAGITLVLLLLLLVLLLLDSNLLCHHLDLPPSQGLTDLVGLVTPIRTILPSWDDNIEPPSWAAHLVSVTEPGVVNTEGSLPAGELGLFAGQVTGGRLPPATVDFVRSVQTVWNKTGCTTSTLWGQQEDKTCQQLN